MRRKALVNDFETAGVKIRVVSDFDIKASGYSELFRSSFSTADSSVFITTGDLSGYTDVVSKNGVCNICRDTDGGRVKVFYDDECGRNHFLVKKTEDGLRCILNSECPESGRDMYCFWSFVGIEDLLLEHSRLVLHCSYIGYKEKAVLFCGRSGIGKSTQAALWEKYCGAVTVNGDRAAVYRENGRFYAASLPVCGSSGKCLNETRELAAVVMLGQAKENRIERLSPKDAVMELFRNCPGGISAACADICTDVSLAVPVYSLDCVPDRSAVDTLKEVIV